MDMLVKLYDIEDSTSYLSTLDEGIIIKRAIAPEKHIVVNWVIENFSKGWGSECDVAFSSQPVSCFIAVLGGKIIGFACYNATYKGFFGPEGVQEDFKGKGIGKSLLLRSLQAMKSEGFAYAIIGAAGPKQFYEKVCGAEVIEGSKPGIYRNPIQ